jgi:outer membrane receptor protein involved in Fe transport
LESKDNGSKFKANLSYKPDEDLLLYASWAQGFRLGRPTVGVPVATCDTNGDGLIDGTNVSVDSTRKVNSDSLNNYEIGAKSTLLNRRMIVDAAIYHIDWKGLPIATAAPGSSAVCGYTANAGAATSNGIELQVSLLILEGLRADLGGSYTRAELSKDAPEQGWPKGARLPGSPRASANLAVQYDFGLLGRKAFVRADSLYTGKFYGDLLQTPNTAAGDYAKVDAEAGVAFGDVDMKLFVHNLTNQDAFTWRGTYDRGDAYGYRLRPRTVGVQLDYRFH